MQGSGYSVSADWCKMSAALFGRIGVLYSNRILKRMALNDDIRQTKSNKVLAFLPYWFVFGLFDPQYGVLAFSAGHVLC